MSPLGTGTEAIRQELERVLKGAIFVRNERLSRFLRFVVERHLEGRDHELKESVDCDRGLRAQAGLQPKQDPIVRTEATPAARAAQTSITWTKGEAMRWSSSCQRVATYRYFATRREVAPVRDLSMTGPGGLWLLSAVGRPRGGSGSQWLVVVSCTKRAHSDRGSAVEKLEPGSSQRLLCRRPYR